MAARAAGVEYFENRSLVTMLTRSSVHWAERIVAMSNSNGVSWTRAHSASAYSRARSSATWLARFLLLVAAAGIGQQGGVRGPVVRGNRLSLGRRRAASGRDDSEKYLFEALTFPHLTQRH